MRGDSSGMTADDPDAPSSDESFDEALLSLAAELAPRVSSSHGIVGGTIVGEHFEIERKLGSGGMGVVFAARDTRLERVVALKLVRDPELGRSALRLAREAKAMAKLAHPNVVAVFEVGHYEGSLFIAMELVDGESARQWARARPRTCAEIVDVYLQAAAGLAAAHDAGLVHRDFKPDNVLVGRDGRARVADFGLARTWAHQDATLQEMRAATDAQREPPGSASDAVAGTTGYLAPELYGGAAPTPRSDQFAFGVALFEVLFGFVPHRRRRGGRVAWTSQPVASDSLPRDVPEWLQDIVQRAIEVDPADRFESMHALSAAIVRGRERTRRRRLGSVAAATLTAAVVASLALGKNLRDPPCTDAEATAANVFSEATRAAIADAAAGDRESTRATLRVAEGMVDAWLAKWIEARREACLATRVHGSQSEALLDRANACLDERLADLDALVDALVTNESVREQADAHASELRETAACRDSRYLAARGAPIEDADDRAEAERIRAELHRIDFLPTDEASLAEQRARVDQLIAEAARLDHPPTRAAAELLAGKLALEADERVPARALLRGAYTSAASSGDDDVAARAAIALAHLAGLTEDRIDAAEPWLDVVQVGIESHRVDPHMRAQLESTRSMVLQRAQDYDAAIAASRRAVELAAESDNPYAAYSTRLELAASLDASGKPTAAIEEYDTLISGLTENYGDSHPLLAVALTNRGLAHYAAHHYEAALLDQRRALTLYLEFYGEGGASADRMLNLGLVLVETGALEEAVALIQRGLAIWERIGPPREQAPFLDALGRAETLRGDHARALDYFTRAFEIRAALPADQQDELAYSYEHIGDAQIELGRHTEALASYRLAIARWHAVDARHPRRAQALYGAARASAELGALQDAVDFTDVLLRLAESAEVDAGLVALARFERALAWWRIDQRPIAIEEARHARADLVAVLGPQHSRVAAIDAAAAKWLSPASK
ncbi:MAG TPA: serine/threonine-protein kinase [Nannocystaceae bacterium]|nr:serine/threonine-protein kinase [Nannocystaceae bacterium]